MPRTQDMTPDTATTPSEDLATILSTLPRGGVEDDVTRLVEVYEAGERAYRAASVAGTPVVGSSASTSA